MARKSTDERRFRRLVMDFHKGRASRAEIAAQIHSHSTSISLKSLIRSLGTLFPGARLTCHQAKLRTKLLCATQAHMEKAKYELVCLLFDEAETFDSYNREFFEGHPIAALHIGGGRYAILDGHHRIRRYAELTGGSSPVRTMVITTSSPDLIARFRQEVEEVKRRGGTADVGELPLV